MLDVAILKEGQRLGSYEIESMVGKGGMAEVYKATHVALERAVAIKVLNPDLNADPTFPLRFLREAKAVARLNHPNIITIHDFDDRGKLAYLVMELAPGGTLRERAGRFKTLSEAVEGLAPVCEALQFAHDRGIVHRDVKPVNVLIDEHGRPRLADFGLARIASETLDITLLGTSVGSPHYEAPEQALGEDIDHRADIYSLGVVAYEVIGGQLPYIGRTPAAVLQQHISSPPPSIRTLLPDAPTRLETAIQRAMAKRREDRFSSAADFLAELREAAAEAPSLPIRAGRGEETAAGTQTDRVATGSDHLAETEVATSRPGQAITVPHLRHTAEPNVSDEAIILPERPARGTPVPNGTLTAAAQPLNGAAAVLPAPVHRRPTGFAIWQWAALGATLLILLFIDAGGLWLGLGSPSAGSVPSFFGDHLVPITSVLAGLALALGIVNATLMRIAVLDDHHLSLETYRRLRQDHRYVGYTAALIAITVELLTWVHVLRLGMPAAVAAPALAFGTALLVVAVSKVAVVRFVPGGRRYLPWFGVTLLVLFVLVFVLSLLS